ncbi:hypothetical protein B0H11DRAFT_1301937 [Mycena galericulata]|nr:hypothetical protein B0H11DRAFT_1301937 [Mycena galericulata]
MEPPPAVPHPCYATPHPKSALKPDTTFTLKFMKMRPDAIPASYPYLTPAIPGLYRNSGVNEHLPVPFFEFRGTGAPPADVGSPGDVYIDCTPAAHALYSRSEVDWTRWAGPADAADTPLAHPLFADCASARYLWFHPAEGVEWVCARTVSRRQQTLRADGILKGSHAGSAQAGLELASQIIGGYLSNGSAAGPETKPPSKKSPVKRARVFSRVHSAPDSDSEEGSRSDSDLSEAFFPSKRARKAAACGDSKPLSSPRRPTIPDQETVRLEAELAALKADGELQALRDRKRALVAVIDEQSAGGGYAATILQMLQNEYKSSCHPSPSPTPDEAKQRLPDLRCRVDEGKKRVLAARVKREDAEKELAERLRACDELRTSRGSE